MTPKVEELVARLRARLENVYDGASQDHHWMPDELCHEAADSLTILSARVMELEAVLQKIAASPSLPWMDRVQLYEETARAALQTQPHQ